MSVVADLLDKAREQIAQECKWTPAIYEIGKLARKLRKSGTTMSKKDSNEVSELLEQWQGQITPK